MSQEQDIVKKETGRETGKESGRRGGKSAVPAALVIGIAGIICCLILIGGFLKYKGNAGRSISATGSASVDFDSDMIVWRGSFSASDTTAQAAYDKIKKDAAVVKDYLEKNGLQDSEIVFNSVDISQKTNNTYDANGNVTSAVPDGYDLNQGIVITSKNIDTVEKISRDISSLLDSGVEFVSNPPEYYYTKMDSVKLDLIDKATKNARSRINIIAKEAGADVGQLAGSDLGVFQITAKNSGTSDYSYDGYFDTSSRQKTATITVKLKYTLK